VPVSLRCLQIESDRPWDAYADDHLGLMDHLGISEFLVLGFCIGGPPSALWRPCWRSPVATARSYPISFTKII
jgi:hypothetical protein